MKVIVGISGATGAIYGIRLLEELKKNNVESHLVLSKWATKTISIETNYTVEDVIKLASVYHPEDDLGATISSGSFLHNGMVVAPCSMKTMSAINQGYTENLISRAADVTIKENRKLIIMPRETPLSRIHLRNMLDLANIGVTIMPPMPAFYNKPKNLNDIINHTVGRVLDHLGVDHRLVKRWSGVTALPNEQIEDVR